MPQYELNLRDYWQILRKRRWVFIVSFVAILISTVLYTKSQKPLYRAMATVRVVQRKTLGCGSNSPLDSFTREKHAPAARVGLEAVVQQPLLQRLSADLHAILGEDPQGLIQDALDQVVAEYIQCGAHDISSSRLRRAT